MSTSGLPEEAIAEVLRLGDCPRADVRACVVAEPQARVPDSMTTARVDHHQAHAATAFFTSPFDRTTALICDTDRFGEVSAWACEGHRLHQIAEQWRGRGFAWLYSECAGLVGFRTPGAERRLEALAHLGRGERVAQLRPLLRYVGWELHVERGWRAHVHDMIRAEQQLGRPQPVETASALQQRIGELLLEFLADVRAAHDSDRLCLGGGLFYNTYLNTVVRRSGLFREVFVPVNPGNSGLALGAALLAARQEDEQEPESARATPSPFLGPAYDCDSVKLVLDGCKLSYSYMSESATLDAAVDALTRGQLVAWFQGRMEWGPRALGHRSILADPQSPYVLDNLNSFLRKRERWRAFGISVCEDEVPELLCGPVASPFMEYQYGVKAERLLPVVPPGATSIRVQTVGPEAGLFWALLKRMQQATGTGALVNTSFNGFHEPIACSPRDAVRVFYGTGLDVAVIGRFILRK